MADFSDIWITRPLRSSQETARQNARKAMVVLAQRRREREDVERYLADRARHARRTG
jgi:hypothetical protein